MYIFEMTCIPTFSTNYITAILSYVLALFMSESYSYVFY